MKTTAITQSFFLLWICGCATTGPVKHGNSISDSEFIKLAEDIQYQPQMQVEAQAKPRSWFAGAWIGTCDSDQVFVRLLFEADGSVVLGRSTYGGKVETASLPSSRLKNGTFFAGHMDSGKEDGDLWVEATGIREYVVVVIDFRGWKRSLTLHRERLFQGEFQRVVEAMNKLQQAGMNPARGQ